MDFRALLPLSAILGILLLSGCAQNSAPQPCLSVPQAKFSNCVYAAAVLEQNPFFCYSIADLEQRAACIRGATDPNVKKALQRSQPQEREAVFAEPGAGNETAPAQPQSPEANDPSALLAACSRLSGDQKDSCMVLVAANYSIVSICDYVNGTSAKGACIAQVAKKTRDLDSCKTLSGEQGRSLCRLYAQGGAQ